MKKVVLLLVIVMLSTFSFAEGPEVSSKTRIVVLPFKDLSKTQFNTGEKISSMLAGKLGEMARFQVVDRTELDKLLEEQKLSLTGMVDAEQSLEVGKLAAAKLAFTGNVVSVSTYRELVVKKEKENEGVGTKILTQIVDAATNKQPEYKKEWNAKVSVTIKVLDIETGMIVKSFAQEATFVTNDVHSENAAVDGALAVIADNAMGSMKELFAIKSYIIMKDGSKATIRLGKDMGIKPGTEFNIYAPSSFIKDKFSDTEIKVQGERTGLLIVEKVDNNSAVARIVRGAGRVSEGNEIKEKMFSSMNLDLSFGVTPFNIANTTLNKRYGYKNGINNVSFEIAMKQEAKKDAPYINLNFGPAYQEIKPTFDLYILLNAPISAAGLDINLEFAKDLFEVIEVSAGAGIGGKVGFGNIGTVNISQDKTATTWEKLFDTGTDLKNGASIDVSGFSFDLKAKAKVAVNMSESMALFGEGGYMLSRIGSWEMKTKDVNDIDVKLGNADISPLDMSGVYFGGGVRFTF